MSIVHPRPETTVTRQVFKTWSITIPATMAETFVERDGYWNARDTHRSVSLTSVRINDKKGRPATSRELLARLPVAPGPSVDMPPGLAGWAAVITPPKPARAGRAISGIVAVDGGVLLATITSDDLTWAEAVWRSIRTAPMT